MGQDPGPAYAHCEALLREADKDRWLAALFAPADRRPHLHALEAFAIEVARVRTRVKQPLAGELRLQWWRDVIEGEARGDALANPVAAALLDTVAVCRLSGGILIDALEAHRVALYGGALPDVPALETFLDATLGGSIRLQAQVLTGGPLPDGEPARHAAAALGIADLIRDLPQRASDGFAAVPDDILARHGAGQNDLRAERLTDAITAALADLRVLARRHLAALRGRRRDIDERAAPAFLIVNLVEGVLRRSERSGTAPFEPLPEIPQWRRQWILWRAARRGGVL